MNLKTGDSAAKVWMEVNGEAFCQHIGKRHWKMSFFCAIYASLVATANHINNI